MKKRILVLFAHPAQRRSEANVPMIRAVRALEQVTLVDLYAEYPTFDIDVDREQDRLLRHDVIVFQHPLYWYSTPALLKEWQDHVLEYGFAYGADGTALRDKIFLCVTTAGGTASAYLPGGVNQFPVRELLRPLEQTATLCNMLYLPPFVLFEARTASTDGRIAAHIADYVRLLQALRDARLDIEAAARLETLNGNLAALIREP